jgi:hypothetical protein
MVVGKAGMGISGFMRGEAKKCIPIERNETGKTRQIGRKEQIEDRK